MLVLLLRVFAAAQPFDFHHSCSPVQLLCLPHACLLTILLTSSIAWPRAVAWKPDVSIADMMLSRSPPLLKSWPLMMGVSGTVSVGTRTAWHQDSRHSSKIRLLVCNDCLLLVQLVLQSMWLATEETCRHPCSNTSSASQVLAAVAAVVSLLYSTQPTTCGWAQASLFASKQVPPTSAAGRSLTRVPMLSYW